ncbi:MAG: hypothetical protein ACLQLC_07835 [Candidatus Sulfotelmatobacter sp.]
MNDNLLSKIADRIDRSADRLRFTGKIADAEACSEAASRIREGMSVEQARALEAHFMLGVSSGVRTRLSALSGSGEYDSDSAATPGQPEGANSLSLSLSSPDLPPAGQPGQASMGMETISQNMQYAAALSQDSYVDPYSGAQYPTNPLLTDPMKGGPSPYYPGGRSVNSYNAKSPAASPSGQTPDLYKAFQNFSAYSAPSNGFDSGVSPFFPGRVALDPSQMLASIGLITPPPDSIASGNGSTYMPLNVVQDQLQGQTPNVVRRNGEDDLHYLVTIDNVLYDAYFNDSSKQIPLDTVELVPVSQSFSDPTVSIALLPVQPIPPAAAPAQTRQAAAPPAPRIPSSAVLPFYLPPAKGDIFTLVQYHDTGNTFLNYGVNWYFALANLSGAILNLPGEMLASAEDAARAIGFNESEIEAARMYNPTLAGQAAMEVLPGAWSYLGQELSALNADQRGSVNLSKLTGMEGPGSIVRDFSINNMSKAAAAYQARAGGLPRGVGYYIYGPSGPVQFDGYINGALIETKYYESDGVFVKAANAFIENPNTKFAQEWYDERVFGKHGTLAQAERQLAAAGNYPVEWRVASQEAAVLIQQIFGAFGFHIQVVYFP